MDVLSIAQWKAVFVVLLKCPVQLSSCRC